jgi:hypothetical protein
MPVRQNIIGTAFSFEDRSGATVFFGNVNFQPQPPKPNFFIFFRTKSLTCVRWGVTAVPVGQRQRLYSVIRMFTWFYLISIIKGSEMGLVGRWYSIITIGIVGAGIINDMPRSRYRYNN